MAHILTKRGAQDNIVTYEHMCDTHADLNNIPSNQMTLGSTAIVLRDENDALGVYMSNSNKEWVPLLAVGGETTPAPSPVDLLHVLSSSDYDPDTHIPTVENPEMNVVYLVPSGEETGNNLFDEWIYTGSNWEQFGGVAANVGGAQADWNQNDKNAADYIKNRICYEEEAEEEVLLDVIAEKVQGNAVMIGASDFIYDRDNYNPYDTYEISYAGVTYYKGSFIYDTEDYLYAGNNEIYFDIDNSGGVNKLTLSFSLNELIDNAPASGHLIIKRVLAAELINTSAEKSNNTVTASVEFFWATFLENFDKLNIIISYNNDIYYQGRFNDISDSIVTFVSNDNDTICRLEYDDNRTLTITLNVDENAPASGNLVITQVSNPIIHKIDPKYIYNSDWNQNDSNGFGYIKNRICYEEHFPREKILLDIETSVSYDEDGDAHLGGNSQTVWSEQDIQAGLPYEISYAGKILYSGTSQYSSWLTNDNLYCEIQDNQSLSITVTNKNIGNNLPSTGRLVFTLYPPIIHTINPKYLPDITKNWKQDDPTEKDYIENRPNIREGYHDNDYNSKAIIEGDIQDNLAYGEFAHAEGSYTNASGNDAHAEGYSTTASGLHSHTEGSETIASGSYSHAEGERTIAYGGSAHSEGEGSSGQTLVLTGTGTNGIYTYNTSTYVRSGTILKYNDKFARIIWVSGNQISLRSLYSISSSVSFGNLSSTSVQIINGVAADNCTHSEGARTIAIGQQSHSEGLEVIAEGHHSHAEGSLTHARGSSSHAEGYKTIAVGDESHAEGVGGNSPNIIIDRTLTTVSAASGTYTINNITNIKIGNIIQYQNQRGIIDAINGNTVTLIATSGNTNKANFGNLSNASITVITGGIAFGPSAHSEGYATSAIGSNSHSEGDSTTAYGSASHAEGKTNLAYGDSSHAEGKTSQANGTASHSEGYQTKALATYAHAEGRSTIAEGVGSHAEGSSTNAIGNNSHTEGLGTTTYGIQSHAEGYNTIANGDNSHTEGQWTEANGACTHVFGAYNINNASVASSSRGTYVEIVGNGASNSSRSNARTLDWNGNETLAGTLTCSNSITIGNTTITEAQLQALLALLP